MRIIFVIIFIIFSINIFAQEITIFPLKNLNQVEFLDKDGDLSNYIGSNISLPIYANGVIRYKVSFMVNNDSTTSEIDIDDSYKMHCTPCKDSLKKVLTRMPLWRPTKLGINYAPVKVSIIVKIDLTSPK